MVLSRLRLIFLNFVYIIVVLYYLSLNSAFGLNIYIQSGLSIDKKIRLDELTAGVDMSLVSFDFTDNLTASLNGDVSILRKTHDDNKTHYAGQIYVYPELEWFLISPVYLFAQTGVSYPVTSLFFDKKIPNPAIDGFAGIGINLVKIIDLKIGVWHDMLKPFALPNFPFTAKIFAKAPTLLL